MISPAAEAALGDAYAHLNQLDKAVDAFKKAASMADSKADEGTNNSLSPIFIIKAGEILESQDKKDEALKLYQDAKKSMLTLCSYRVAKSTSTSSALLTNLY